MLSGNPNTFAIWCDAVDSWSTARFANGCFGYFIAGNLVWSTRSTLGVDLHMLSNLQCMKNAIEDLSLFDRSPSDAYQELCRRAFPTMDSDAEQSDFSHFVSAESLSDDGHYFFLVEGVGKAKLIYGFKDVLSSVREVVLASGEFQSTVRDAIERGRNGLGPYRA